MLEGMEIIFDTGRGNKKQLISVTKIAKQCTQEYCAALMALHACTRCDTTSASQGIGKVKLIKVIQKMPKFQKGLSKLGETWDVRDELFAALEEFTCILYGSLKFGGVNKLREMQLLKKCGNELSNIKNVDMSSLPPCKRSLVQHVRRVNYQVGVWRRAHLPKPNIPSPIPDHGWEMKDDQIQPLCFEGEVMPTSIADILEQRK